MVTSNNKNLILEYIKSFKSRELVPLICPNCNNHFLKTKQKIQLALNTKKQENIFCSSKCSAKAKETKISKPCSCCGKEIQRTLSEIRKNKTNNIFCNQSCAAKYNNEHKTTGTRRSKLEVWLEEKLLTLYPEQEFLFNDKTKINSELDIFIPSLNLAFELNGIFHYEPIYGTEKLKQIQDNDNNKFQRCQQCQISLCIIDTSWIKHNKESNFQKILNIIIEIVTEHSKTLTS